MSHHIHKLSSQSLSENYIRLLLLTKKSHAQYKKLLYHINLLWMVYYNLDGHWAKLDEASYS